MNPFLKLLLFPITAIYWMVLSIREFLFNIGILRSVSYPIPIICVGNLSFGGTGKTPHIEYLIRLLQSKYKVATLSRGYGRKTSGFKIGDENDNARTIGDEPFQLLQKFKNCIISVDENRRNGIKNLLSIEDSPNVILMDDGFQHRYVQPGINILLTEYNHSYNADHLFPAGRLRDKKSAAKRADIVIVSKCPDNITPLDIRSKTMDMNLLQHQRIFFTSLKYQKIHALNKKGKEFSANLENSKEFEVVLMCAIANPELIIEELKRRHVKHELIQFPDHHYFSDKDYLTVNSKFQDKKKSKILLLTEKDAVKIDKTKIEQIPTYILPIEVYIHPSTEGNFDHEIISHVESY